MGINKKSSEIENLLRAGGVKPSPARILTLKAISESPHPLSAQEIEDRISTLDRSSITRTLPILVKARLIHAFSDGSGAMKYESCHDHVKERHTDEHPHFHCRVCGKTICLEESGIIGDVKIPDGYEAESISLIITGVCGGCR